MSSMMSIVHPGSLNIIQQGAAGHGFPDRGERMSGDNPAAGGLPVCIAQLEALKCKERVAERQAGKARE
jgi:hypothetical protein